MRKCGLGLHTSHVLARVRPQLASRRGLLVGAVVLALLLTGLSVQRAADARGSVLAHCERFRTASLTRSSLVSGSGRRVVVIGDSWSAGLGLRESAASWPSRLSGRVAVAGFSGSGFTRGASPCARVSFADRAPSAVRRGADLVVVQGGLNDVDQPAAAIRSGFARLMRTLEGYDVVVVGPAAAPARAGGVPRVDALLAKLSASYAVPYVRTSDLRLTYLRDGLHLTPRAHAAFGDAVAARLAGR